MDPTDKSFKISVKENVDFSIDCNETTSPSQLQEVTLDDLTFNGSMGLRSPTGPMRGRSVKEFEEQLGTLKKENFNLKLRIYFLEEKMGTSFKLDKDNAIKQNIELLVEVESLRKEIETKQDLLGQAVKAMELDEDEHKKLAEMKNKQIAELQIQLEEFQEKYKTLEEVLANRQIEEQTGLFAQAFDVPDLQATETIKELQAKIETLEMQLHREQSSNYKLENLLKEEETKGSTHLKFEEQLAAKESQIKNLTAELEEKEQTNASSNLKIRALQETLALRSVELQTKQTELDQKDSKIRDHLVDLEHLRKLYQETRNLYESEQRKVEKQKAAVSNRNNRIVELESSLEKYRSKIMSLEAKLEAAETEVKTKADELQSIKSPMRKQKSTITDVDSFLVPSQNVASELAVKKTPVMSPSKTFVNTSLTSLKSTPKSTKNRSSLVDDERALVLYEKNPEKFNQSDDTLDLIKEELIKSKKHVTKLEQDQLRACKIIQTMLDNRRDQSKQIEELQSKLHNKDKEISELMEKMKLESSGDMRSTAKEDKCMSIQTKISEMNLTATTSPPSPDSQNASPENVEDLKQLLEQYKHLTAELDKQKQILLSTVKEKDSKIKRLQDHCQSFVEEINAKQNQVLDLELQLMSQNDECKDLSLTEKKDFGSEKPSCFWVTELNEKDKEIERLESELRKRTCDLQGLVNNELWEKNKEIEKMQSRFGNIAETKDGEIRSLKMEVTSLKGEILAHKTELSKLKNEIATKDLQLEMLKSKISDMEGTYSQSSYKQIESSINSACDDTKTLQEQLRFATAEKKCLEQEISFLKSRLKISSEKDHHPVIAQLNSECKDLQIELEKSEQLRQESNEICTVLNIRLEELAKFLDSLLKQKLVLGLLGNKHNTKMQHVIDQTLDLSRTLNISMNLVPDQSLMQLTNLSNLLNSTRNDSINDITIDESLDTSHDKKYSPDASFGFGSNQAQVIEVLRAQVENLKKEIKVRDIELENKASIQNENLMHITNMESQTMQRPLKEDKTANFYFNDNQSESETWSEPDRNVSQARMGILSESVKKNSSSRKIRMCQHTSTEEDLSNRRSSGVTITTLNRQINSLEAQLKEKEIQLQTIETQFAEAEETIKCEKAHVVILQKKIEELEQVNKQQEESLSEYSKVKQDTEVSIETLHRKVEEQKNKIAELENERFTLIESGEKAEKEIKIAYDKLKQIEKIAEEINQNAQTEMRTLTDKIALIENEKDSLIESIRNEEKQKYDDKIQLLEEECENRLRAIKSKTETQIEKLTDAAAQLQQKYDAEYVKRTEVEKLKEELVVLENLKANLAHSEGKIAALEDSERRLSLQLQETEREHRDKLNYLRKELDNANLQYSEAMLEKTRLINEKAGLEKQIKEFCSKEDDFIKQVNEFQHDFLNMKESFQKRVTNLERQKALLEGKIEELDAVNAELKIQLIKVEGGNSGDHEGSKSMMDIYLPKSCYAKHLGNKVKCEDCNGLANRMNANSPDLGIESDQARMSSLEGHIANRPYFQTLELSESMSNLLDKDMLLCANEQCSVKTKQMINENAELKKKLTKTRHALEDTVTQLSIANYRKKQVEKTICKQIHKTNQVLRKAKANLDSGSESETLAK